MPSPALFIDANCYLWFYKTISARHVLRVLDAQRDHIFVTRQIVDEVTRNKLGLAQEVLSGHFAKAKVPAISFPDYLLGTSEEDLSKLKQDISDLKKTGGQVENAAREAILKSLHAISQSTDQVSAALARIFNKAIAHSEKELKRAIERKQHGNPPGKKTDPLGDQLSWEQFLSFAQDKDPIWIISEDSDFWTRFDRRHILNPFLYQDLCANRQPQPTIHCFADLLAGLTNFAETQNVGTAELPTDDQKQEIVEEEVSQNGGASRSLDMMMAGYIGGNRWRKLPGRLVFEDGRLHEYTIGPDTLRTVPGSSGLTVGVRFFQNPRTVDGALRADVGHWVFHDGKVLQLATIAKDVEVVD
jgi:PIN domain